MTPEHKRRALNSDTEEADMLSSLPGEVKDKILTLLPVKEAGRTGILSRQWRYTWSSIPELTIRDGSYCGLFTKLVDGILFLHQGPVYKFDLHTKNFHDSEPYDRWLLHLSRNGIRELILQLRFNYKIPSSLFSCQALTCLHLSNCTIKLPHDFEGFKLLRTVMLEKSAVSGNELEKMVSGSPLLESLFLWDFKECLILNIDAPNLKNLVVLGKFIDIQLWTPGLLNLWVELKVKPVGNHHRRGKLAQALGHIPAIEKLEMHKHFVAHLAYGPLLEKFPVKFDHLKEICFSIDLADLEAAALALSLFQNSPKLKILDIRFIFGDNSVSGGPDFWEPIDREDCSFEHLQTVTIHNFLPSRPMFSFVRFVLSAAPNLNELTMSKENSDGVVDPTTFKQLLRFKRASANAEIIFV